MTLTSNHYLHYCRNFPPDSCLSTNSQQIRLIEGDGTDWSQAYVIKQKKTSNSTNSVDNKYHTMILHSKKRRFQNTKNVFLGFTCFNTFYIMGTLLRTKKVTPGSTQINNWEMLLLLPTCWLCWLSRCTQKKKINKH